MAYESSSAWFLNLHFCATLQQGIYSQTGTFWELSDFVPVGKAWSGCLVHGGKHCWQCLSPGFLGLVFAVFCRTQLVSLDWHRMWSCNIQFHCGRPSLSLGSVQKTLECEALPRGFEGAITHGRKVWKKRFAAFLGRETIYLRTRNAELGKSCSKKTIFWSFWVTD